MNEIRELLTSRRARITPEQAGLRYFRHQLVGDLDLDYESFDLAGDVGQTMVVYTAQAGSPSQVALDQLARGITERAATR